MRGWLRSILVHPSVSNSTLVNLFFVFYSIFKSRFIVSWPVISVGDLKHEKTSDTLVIMGAGSSINELDARTWKEFDEYDVAGVSYSCLLPIKQKFYFYETPSVEGLVTQHYNVLLPIILDGIENKKIENAIWRNPYERSPRLSKFLDGFRRVVVSSTLTRDPNVLRRLIKTLNFLRIGSYAMIQSRSLIFAIAHLGMSMNYKNIIFCGVDLNGSPYFFENNKDYKDMDLSNPFSFDEKANNNNFHATSDPALGMPIDVALKVLVEQSNVNFFVTSNDSRLSEFLPKWQTIIEK